MSSDDHPAHLDPSELGTKEYWDAHYAQDLDLAESHGGDGDDNDSTSSPSPPPSPSDLASWFDDVDAPARTLAFLTSTTFPLSPNYNDNDNVNNDSKDATTNHPAPQRRKPPSVLDLGTGNGATLFQLRLRGNFTGPMLGVDYSPQSIQLARSLARRYASASTDDASSNSNQQQPRVDDIHFQVLDLIHTDPTTQPWWPSGPPDGSGGGFDLVLDKGTFDAISLSSETVTVTVPPPPLHGDSDPQPQQHHHQQRIHEIYPRKITPLIKPGGFLLVTSCNWTEDEVVRWFTTPDPTITSTTTTAASPSPNGQQGTPSPQTVLEKPQLELYATVPYPKFSFGGHEGQGVAGVCFRRVV